MNSVKLINVDGSAAFELKKKVKSAKLRLEFAAIESDIESRVEAGMKDFQSIAETSYEKALETMKISDLKKVMDFAGEEANVIPAKVGSIIIESITNKYKDEKILRLAQCTLDGSKLNEANAELFNSSWDGDFWQFQDLDILEELVNSFR